MKSPSLFKYPESTLVNQLVTKSKIYQAAQVNTATKDLFVKQVDQIQWVSKLSGHTLNIEGHKQCLEIEVFRLTLKEVDVDLQVLETIDKTIPHPIIFEVVSAKAHTTAKLKVMSCYKTIGSNGKVNLSDYYSSQWLQQDSERSNLPIAINTQGLYQQILASLLPYAIREQETFSELIQRIKQIEQHDVKQLQLQNKLQNEKQFKNKVKINEQLKQIKQKLSELKL